MPDEILDNLRLELRRGYVIVAALAGLRVERYGYALRKALADQGVEIDENTLYPLLRRLESQGLLVSVWREEEKRNKRFYRLSAEGERVLAQLLGEWAAISAALNRIVDRVDEASAPASSLASEGSEGSEGSEATHVSESED